MAVAYKSAGSGVSTETSAAALSPLCPATVDAGDILIAHVYWEATTTAPSTPAGWDLLSGPHVIETTIARHWVYGRVADGTEDGAAVAFGNPAVTTQRAARIYSFSGRVVGPVTALVKGFAHTSNANDPTAPNVTTTKAGALAVLLVGQNDNNALASFTGESGGDYTEAVAELTANLTPGLSLGIETATPTANPGTITGGTDNTTNDPAGVIGFQILADSSEVIAFGSASATASATLALTAPTQVPLGAASAVASPTLSVFTPVPAMITGGYQNVAPNPSPSFEVDTAGWGQESADVFGVSSAWSSEGAASAHYVRTGDGSSPGGEGIYIGTQGVGDYYYPYTNPAPVPIMAGEAYSIRLDVNVISKGAADLFVHMTQQGDSGPTATHWEPLTLGEQTVEYDATALGTTSRLGMIVGYWGGNDGRRLANGETLEFYVDAVVIEKASATVPIAASATASASLALTAPTQLPLAPASATASATLSVLIPIPVPLDGASGASDATLALTAPTAVPLAASTATASPTLVLSAPTTIVLGTSTATASASLGLSATTQIPLDPASSAASATLSLSAATGVELGGASSASTATLSVTATTQVPLGSADAVSTATLAVTAGTATIPLDPTAGASSGTLAITVPTQLPLDAASASSTASAALSAPTALGLDGASGSASATLAITAPTQLALGSSTATTSALLSVSAATQVALGGASALASGTCAVSIATVAPIVAVSISSGATSADQSSGNTSSDQHSADVSTERHQRETSLVEGR